MLLECRDYGNDGRIGRAAATCAVMTEPFSLNEEQRAAAEHPGGHVLVLAGAGTGKTRTIVARAAYLIEQGVVPERIAVLTFTRRAAGELQARLGGLVGEDQARLTGGRIGRDQAARSKSALALDEVDGA